MTPVAIGVIFLAYGFGLWGYCLVKDYDINIYQLFRSEWPPPKFQQVGKQLKPGSLTTTAAEIVPL